MQTPKWLYKTLLLLVSLAALAAIARTDAYATPTTRKINIQFADSPVQICNRVDLGIGIIPNDTTLGQAQRNYIRHLFEQVYPEIVAVYGEPLLSHPDGLTVTIYYRKGDSSMYLSHKTGIDGSLINGLIGAFLFPLTVLDINPCSDPLDVPDHAIFLSDLPKIDDLLAQDPRDIHFDHLFTHELIHVFHDRMDFLGWYTHSWVEEGMTEAATELVAERLLRGGGPYARDLIEGGINHNAFDNLKHYDMWNYPYNGAWGGDSPSRNALPALQWFYAGFSTTGATPGSDISFVNHSVIPIELRYAAAASLWFLLAKACSTDGTHPDFFVRLNQRLLMDDVTNINDEKMIALIEKTAPDAQVEGVPVRQWLNKQAFLKGAPRDDGHGTVFIDVRNPENFQVDAAGPNFAKVNIVAYAVYSLDLDDPGNLLGGLNGAELPMKGCGLTLKIIDAAGRERLNKPMQEVGHGKYVFDGAITDTNGQPVLLEEGSYIIRVTAGICDRLHLGTIESVTPGGVTTATFALRGNGISSYDARHYLNGEDDQISGEKALAVGAALTPWDTSSGLTLQTVGTVTKAFLPDFPEPSATELPTIDTRGKFALADNGQIRPFELILGQRLPDGSKNQRRLFLPYPYRRVAWLDVTPDFLIDTKEDEIWVEPGKTVEVTALLIPNGVSHTTNTGYSCPISVGVTSAVPGVNFIMEGGFAIAGYTLSTNAPKPTPAKITIKTGANAQPGTYAVKILGTGETGNTCGGLSRSGSFQLVVAKSLKLSLNAVAVNGNTSLPAAATITMATVAGPVGSTTPVTLSQRQFTNVALTADPPQINVNGQWYDFVNWELNNDPGQRISANPLTQYVGNDMVITARYLKRDAVSVTVEARANFSSTYVQIPVAVAYSWATGPAVATGGSGLGLPTGGSSGSGTKTTVFEITPARNASVTLDAPPIVKVNDKYYEFTGWEGGGLNVAQTRLTYQAAGNVAFTAYYRPAVPNNAMFISQSVPPTMYPGQRYNVSVRMKNTGSASWKSSLNYRLGAQNPQDNLTWGLNRADLSSSNGIVVLQPTIVPGGDATFSFVVTAPKTQGVYNFQWRMVQDGVEWFGVLTPNVAVQVVAPPPPPHNAQFVIQSVPTTMTVGKPYNVSIKMRNTGPTTWTVADGFRLVAQGPVDNPTWGVSRVDLPATVAPGAEVTFNFTVSAPATPTTYRFEWRMMQNDVGFGDFTPAILMNVAR